MASGPPFWRDFDPNFQHKAAAAPVRVPPVRWKGSQSLRDGEGKYTFIWTVNGELTLCLQQAASKPDRARQRSRTSTTK
jgi:hypothetical protein